MTVNNVRTVKLRSALAGAARTLLLVSLLIASTVGASAAALRPADQSAGPVSPPAAAPNILIQNAGQFGPGAQFLLMQGNQRIWLTENAVWLVVPGRASSAAAPKGAARGGRELLERARAAAAGPATAVRFTFEGANQAAALEPFDAVAAHVSYLIGNDPEQWHSDVPVWSGVRYRDLYPGIDLVIGDDAASAMPWRLEARPGADLQAVALRVDGADDVKAEGGALQLALKAGTVQVALPAWSLSGRADGAQQSSPVQKEASVFALAPAGVAATSPQAPEGAALLYQQFLAGSDGDTGYGVAVNGSGEAFITGQTDSYDLIPPQTPGPYDPTNTGADDTREAFAAKYGTGGNLLFATYLGGSGEDNAWGIAVDGNLAYVAGDTHSQDFPGLQTGTVEGDVFVVALNATGTGVRYVSSLGGDGEDQGFGIAVDDSNAYVVGSTTSTTLLGHACAGAGNHNLLVAKFSPTGVPVYATCFGDSWSQEGYGIAARNGLAYVTGASESSALPESSQMLVARFQTGGALDTSTVLGGADSDWGQGIAVDASGNMYIAGTTWSSTGFPGTGSTRPFGGGTTDAVVVKLDSSLGVDFATYLGGGTTGGGTGDDYGNSIAVDTVQAFYVGGATQSADFPTLPGADDTTLGGDTDAFVTRMHLGSSELDKATYSTYLGGAQDDWGLGIDTDTAGNAFVTGSAVTAAEDVNAFVAKLKVSDPPTPGPALSIASTGGGANASLSWTWSGAGTVARYQLFRSSAPYFKPGDWSSGLPIFDQLGTSYPDDNVLTQVGAYYYVVKPVNSDPAAGPNSNEVGKFTVQLAPGTN